MKMLLVLDFGWFFRASLSVFHIPPGGPDPHWWPKTKRYLFPPWDSPQRKIPPSWIWSITSFKSGLKQKYLSLCMKLLSQAITFFSRRFWPPESGPCRCGHIEPRSWQWQRIKHLNPRNRLLPRCPTGKGDFFISHKMYSSPGEMKYPAAQPITEGICYFKCYHASVKGYQGNTDLLEQSEKMRDLQQTDYVQ